MVLVDISRAEEFAIKAHGDQQYGKHPYEVHLRAVAEMVAKRNKAYPLKDTLIAIAWLHDSIEDTDVTYEDLVKDFGVCIADAVERLSKQEGEPYDDYMLRVKGSNMAREVKKCDTMCNLYSSFKGNRTKGVVKYSRQMSILEVD